MAVLALAVSAALTACSESVVPIDQYTPPTPDQVSEEGTPHLLEPTEQMRDLARQQCREDPDLIQGEVNAVDPSDPERVLASVTIDCDTVR